MNTAILVRNSGALNGCTRNGLNMDEATGQKCADEGGSLLADDLSRFINELNSFR
jgi:hypothetical protein